MTQRHSRRGFLGAVGAGVATGLAGCLAGRSPEERAERHRSTLSKYADVARAIEDGYEMTTPYVRTDEGVLGLPFVNSGTPDLDPEQPTVLFYDLRDDGTFALLGVEWLVAADDTDSPPSMFGTEFHGPSPGETAFIPEHYGLHAWLFRENPDGLFATAHPGVDPPAYIEDLEAAWSALSPYYADESKAEGAGYTNTERCIATPDGGYGVPIVDAAATGTDPIKPAVLLYHLSTNWVYLLQGAEWYVPVDAADGPPSMFGREFHPSMPGHSPEADQPAHYGLHAWLFRANPRGMFARYNPVVRC